MNFMTFTFEFTDNLKKIIEKLVKKDKKLSEELYKKINEIINSDEITIEHYKNLKYDFSNKKRVHIRNNFVLLFSVLKDKNHIIFLDFEHRDNIYKRK